MLVSKLATRFYPLGGVCPRVTMAELDAATSALIKALDTDAGYEELKALFESLDVSGDGSITPEEWENGVTANKEILEKYFGGVDGAGLGDAFRALDTDGSGALSWDELEAGVMAACVPASMKAAEAEAQAAASVATAEGDAPPTVAVTEKKAEPTVAAATAQPTAVPKEEAPSALLVFGGARAHSMSLAVAERCGGTVVDVEAISEFASSEPSAEGEALLAKQRTGTIVSMKEIVPLVALLRTSRREPLILNGYPRMGSQLAKIEGSAGRVALAVLAGGGDEVDARLADFLRRRGTPLLELPDDGEGSDGIDGEAAAEGDGAAAGLAGGSSAAEGDGAAAGLAGGSSAAEGDGAAAGLAGGSSAAEAEVAEGSSAPADSPRPTGENAEHEEAEHEEAYQEEGAAGYRVQAYREEGAAGREEGAEEPKVPPTSLIGLVLQAMAAAVRVAASLSHASTTRTRGLSHSSRRRAVDEQLHSPCTDSIRLEA